MYTRNTYGYNGVLRFRNMVHAIITSIYCVFLERCLARNSTSTLITVGLVFSLFQHWVVSYEAIASTTELASTSAEIDEKFMKDLLFVPCFVDGVWSNMRQITLYAYRRTSYHSNSTTSFRGSHPFCISTSTTVAVMLLELLGLCGSRRCLT